MRTLLASVMLLVAMQVCQAEVQVQVGDFEVTLESVKKLKELLEVEAESAHAQRRSQLPSSTICENPELPDEFKDICDDREDAHLILKGFDLAVRDTDLCELCFNIACTGC